VTVDRTSLEQCWLQLTRATLPGLSASRGWPVRDDHCFQRILLDAVCGGVWYDHVNGRPAYRRIDFDRLAAAVALGERIAAGEQDLTVLNAQSLRWRRER
jgi:hypothetical protein